MKRARQNSGFTLIEVVVALSLMAAIMMILFMGLRVTANAWHRGEQKLDEHARTMSGQDVVEQQVAAAVPRLSTEIGADNKPVQVVSFSGSPDEARFLSSVSWRGDRTRPQFMADYRVVKGKDGEQLMIGETSVTDDESLLQALLARADDQAPMQPIGDPAERIELSYFRPATQQNLAAEWVHEWVPVQGAELPRAIRVQWTRGVETQVASFPIAINQVATR